MRQRLAAGLLRKIGATETIATSVEEYVPIAARSAEECRDPSRRKALRYAITSAAPAMDSDLGVVRALENSLIDALAEKRMSDRT